MQICVPGCGQRDSKRFRYPETKDAKIAWAGDMNQIRAELQESIDQPVPVPAEQGIAVQVPIEPEGSPASVQLQGNHRIPATDSPFGTGVYAAKWKLPMFGEGGELAT